MRYLPPLILFVALAGTAGAQPLPADTVVPDHYQIHFAPDLANATFEGDETIQVQVLKLTTKIVLHAVDLTFDEVTIIDQVHSQAATVTPGPAIETVTLAVPTFVNVGTARIHIRFRGRLGDELRGLYLSRANGRRYAVSQFEATDARRAFPCFDQPDMKASFSVSAVVDSGDTAISNGALLTDTPGPGDGKHTLSFSITPKMSTYLVALAVGDFQCLEGKAEGVPIRVCATPDKKDMGRFALDASEHILGYYTRYYGIRYPFRKLDLVAVPDFSAGAMENSGAIFFRESLLLLDPADDSMANQKPVANTIAHEMAHQWFGDLVTMRWWDDIWLNEGFATWMAPKPLAEWKPAWHVELDSAVETLEAMEVDALESTRPIRTKLTTPDEINEAFDAIAYQKAAAVLRMVEDYVGDRAFQAGVNAYLKKYAYDNATAEGFWTTLAEVAMKPVDQVLASFVDQAGLPLLDVQAGCAESRESIAVTGERFFATPAHPAEPRAVWKIPMRIKIGGAEPGDRPRLAPQLLTAKEQAFQVSGCGGWVLANGDAVGYYRAVYSADALARLAELSMTHLSAVERLALLSDEWALVGAGRHEIGTYLALVAAMKSETAPQVLDLLADSLRKTHERLTTDADQERFETWVRQVFSPELARAEKAAASHDGGTGAAGEDQEARRAALVEILGYAGRDPVLLARAKALASGEGGKAPSDNLLADVLLPLAAVDGSNALYDRLMASARKARAPQDLLRALFALTQFSQPALVSRTLDYIISDQVRSQDRGTLVADVMRNPAGRQAAWSFLKAHWPALQEAAIGDGGTVLVSAAASFCDAASRDDVKQFFTGRVPAATRTLAQTLERIGNCIEFTSRQQPNLARWLDSRQPH
jgi:aminopeptidase N